MSGEVTQVAAASGKPQGKWEMNDRMLIALNNNEKRSEKGETGFMSHDLCDSEYPVSHPHHSRGR